MFTLITAVVVSATAVRGGSRRGVGVLLSLESRKPQDDRRRDVILGFGARRDDLTLPRQTQKGEEETRLPAALRKPSRCKWVQVKLPTPAAIRSSSVETQCRDLTGFRDGHSEDRDLVLSETGV